MSFPRVSGDMNPDERSSPVIDGVHTAVVCFPFTPALSATEKRFIHTCPARTEITCLRSCTFFWSGKCLRLLEIVFFVCCFSCGNSPHEMLFVFLPAWTYVWCPPPWYWRGLVRFWETICISRYCVYTTKHGKTVLHISWIGWRCSTNRAKYISGMKFISLVCLDLALCDIASLCVCARAFIWARKKTTKRTRERERTHVQMYFQ